MSEPVRPHVATLALSLTAAVVVTGCGGSSNEPPLAQKSAPQATTQPATVPHGDHNPHHGGVVMMKGDLHYEVVLDPTGRDYRLYFSDAVREDVPAGYASAAALTVRRDGEADEPVVLKIDETGESWIGSGRPVGNPSRTSVRVGFTVANEPYSIDLPFGGTK